MSTTPTIYFIDDSATMREVIKIAFRKENINVVACHDATLALTDIEKTRPDIVITDVIMPVKDGYEVCQYIKSHPDLAKTPVVLMSGVVNRAVAEKAFAVRADELLRKPFQPQDLIARVRHLLKPDSSQAASPAAEANAAAALTSIFSGNASVQYRPAIPAPAPQHAVTLSESLAASGAPAPTRPPASGPSLVPAPVNNLASPSGPAAQSAASSPAPAPMAAVPAGKSTNGSELTKLKVEIMRLEGLVKKLQSELQAEREYARGLEAHVKTLQEGH
jgi:CheY-like chemotaxis protein